MEGAVDNCLSAEFKEVVAETMTTIPGNNLARRQEINKFTSLTSNRN